MSGAKTLTIVTSPSSGEAFSLFFFERSDERNEEAASLFAFIREREREKVETEKKKLHSLSTSFFFLTPSTFSVGLLHRPVRGSHRRGLRLRARLQARLRRPDRPRGRRVNCRRCPGRRRACKVKEGGERTTYLLSLFLESGGGGRGDSVSIRSLFHYSRALLVFLSSPERETEREFKKKRVFNFHPLLHADAPGARRDLSRPSFSP